MADGDLTSLANAQAWLALTAATTAQNTALQRLISATSTRIQAFIGYQIAESNYTRSFDGVGGVKIILPDRPVTAVSAVAIDGQAIPAAIFPQAGFVFDGISVGLIGGYRFSRGLQNVTVSYMAGYELTPPDLEQACLEWVSVSFQAQQRDPALIEVSAGDTTEKYGGADSTLGTRLLPMPAATLAACLLYRRVSAW